MAITRADSLTGTKKQKEFFSDFTKGFKKSPYGGDLGRLINNDSVNESLRNLMRTNIGERLFQPLIGSDINALLFENNFPENLDVVETFVRNTITNNEPRVNLLGVEVDTNIYNENEVQVTIVYNLINNPDPVTLTIILKRVR